MPGNDLHFREIRQLVPHRCEIGAGMLLPVFHHNTSAFGVVCLARRSTLAPMLPSPLINPVSLPRNRTPVVLAALNHHDSSLGAFREFAVILPIGSPLKKGRLRSILSSAFSPSFYMLHRFIGNEELAGAFREIYGFTTEPAAVNIEEIPRHGRCHVSGNGENVIVMEAPHSEGNRVYGMRGNLYSVRSDRLLRSEALGKIYGFRPSYGKRCEIEIGGRHHAARDLEDLGLSKPLFGWYAPQLKFLLTNPLESLPPNKSDFKRG